MNTSLRKVAIRLACAHPEDRNWVLQQLSPSEQQQMEELLEEINLLELAVDPSVVDAVMNELEQLSQQPTPLFEQLDSSAHSFWLGLALQSLTPNARRQYLDGNPGLHESYEQFSNMTLPPALAQQLSALLKVREESHEPI